MKLSMLLNLGQALTRSAENDKVTKMIYSFVDYCKSCKYHYPTVPRIGEYISLEEFIIEWAKTYEDSGLYLCDYIDILTTSIGKEFKVVNVLHSINYSTLYCSDLYKLE